ncbi:M1 family metallopeptidase [Brevundimonas nasdae]|uniref:M1 family metallopeptidase n=1 Tax=Brevundimonas nasdae TaxID=172043 RepID=A0ABX8THT9_9CAUL|nr:M1 family metallopeptidase [Brevundimonas nasdae]QYC09360.1 M1 family metallopeptidase [Brevundimonas nasdae]QYC15408.1 M1 family metallopeptidase [Brevundimonas nasdae]
MPSSIHRAAAAAAAASVLALSAGAASAQTEQLRESTAFTLATDQPRTAEQLAMQFDKADLSIKVIPDDRAIDAVAVLDFTALAPLDRLVVELDTLLTISSVQVDGVEVASDRWTNPEGRLTVDLPQTLPTGGKTALRIAYAGQPRVAPRAPWNGGFVWSTAPSGEPWIATAVQGEGCDLFWPCIDSPHGEPGRVDLHITVPSNLSAPSNGRFLGKQDQGDGWTTWNWTAKQPNTYAVALNIGPYEQVTADYASRFGNRIPMTYWHLKTDDPAKVQALFAEFPRMLDFFEATVGPYPFGDEKMGVVETPHLGMEHQTINAYGNEYKLDGRGYDWLLQHEFAHEWFGNQLTNQNADDMWLHEGLGSYMQPLYGRWLHGDRYMQTELADQRRGLINKYPVVSGSPKTEDEVYNSENGPGNDIYSKGSLISHSLRMLIGDAAFHQAVTRLVYGRPDPRPGNFAPIYRSTQDFLDIVNDVTGKDYGWFFRGYLYNAALPVLSETRENGRLKLAWTTGDGAAFPMPVEVEIDGRLRTVAMTGGQGQITVPDGAHVLIDPDNKLLRQLDFIDAYQAYRAEQAAAK